MIAILVPTHAHINSWVVDNRPKIVTEHRVKNEFKMKNGTTCRVFAVQGTIDIERLRGYDWDKIVITYGEENIPWQANCTLRVRKEIGIDPKHLEYDQ